MNRTKQDLDCLSWHHSSLETEGGGELLDDIVVTDITSKARNGNLRPVCFLQKRPNCQPFVLIPVEEIHLAKRRAMKHSLIDEKLRVIAQQ
jgi:hypothetical protein